MKKFRTEMMMVATAFKQRSNWRTVEVELVGNTQGLVVTPHLRGSVQIVAEYDRGELARDLFFTRLEPEEYAPGCLDYPRGARKLFKVTIEEVDYPEGGVSLPLLD